MGEVPSGASASISSFKREETAIVDAIFASGDLDGDGVLSLDEFLKLVESSPSLRRHFTIADAVCLFNNPDTPTKRRLEAVTELAATLELSSGPALEPERAAEVLSMVPGLSPVAIGEFLGSKDTDGFMKSCSSTFFASLSLEGITLDEALRRMSQTLCLPRESQQIDRIVQVLADTYCGANPGAFPDEDAAYLTAFAIVMLNADAHTPTVTKKMTKAEFVRNASLATPQVRTELLEGIYDRVTAEEITLGMASHSNVETMLNATGRSELSVLLGSLSQAAKSGGQ
jgi:hypothetical protein